jgi:beta-N-acetylhexosaminidase
MKYKSLFRVLRITFTPVFFTLLLSCITNKETKTETEKINKISEQKNTPLLDEMIGQMIMVGFRGFCVDEFSQIVKDIKTEKVGGVILFDYDVVLKSDRRNIKSKDQVAGLIKTLKKYAKHPLFIAIDQEGGRVCRLKEKYGFPKTVSQKYLGMLNDEKTTRSNAENIAILLNELGININFSPVVDVEVNPDNPVISRYERSFSSDPVIVASNAGWVIEEYQKHNVFGALKHFPGHGSSREDSHQGFTDVTLTWKEYELLPYEKLIDTGNIKFIMTAHIFNSNLDNDYPATLSKKILTDLLREKLKFQDIIITDDMNMKAITENYGFEQAIELSINAGADILLYANNISYDKHIAEKVFNAIKKLVNEGKIDPARIEESYDRIIDFKNKYL